LRRGVDRAPSTRIHRNTPPLVHRGCRPPHSGHVNVVNLGEATAALVESPTDACDPMTVHDAETFVGPAAVGPYRIRPVDGVASSPLATIKAYVRSAAGR
jgi:hypothetical protein